MSPDQLYLDLLAKVLANTIYEDPTMEPWAAEKIYDADKRAFGRDWPHNAHTMVGLARLNNLIDLGSAVLAEGIPGSFIETGVWRGGCCILMQGILEAKGATDRKVFVCDSFEGLPKPDAARYSADEVDFHHTFQELAVSLDAVKENFRKYGLLKDNVVFVKGLFATTLRSLDTGPLAMLRLDGDMYESTIVALESLYPKLSPGGYCIIDDYGAVAACKKAVDDYRAAHQICATMQEVDWTGVWWQKPRD